MKALAVAAGVSAPLMLSGSADGGFVGVTTTAKPNEFGVFTVNVYAEFDNAGNDFMQAVAGTAAAPLIIGVVGGTFYQHAGGGDLAPLDAFIEFDPLLAFDSFVTIGVKSVGPPNGQPVNNTDLIGWPGFGTNTLDMPNGAWYVDLQEPQGNPFDPVNCFPGDGRVLIGQFSTEDGIEIQGTMLLQFISDNVVVQQVVEFSHAGPPGTLFVDDDNCPGPGNGSLGDPFCSIQMAIDSAAGSGEVVVAPGTYYETIWLQKTNAITVRSSDGPDVTIIDAEGSGSAVSTVGPFVGPDTVLDGFTLPNGGMFNFISGATVTNCIFSGGSGMYNDSGGPTVTNCIFTGSPGYGIYNAFSGPTVTNCTFSGNTVGMYTSAPPPYGATVSNCIFWGNSGGQIVDEDGAVTTVSYSDVQGGWPGTGNIDADPLFLDAAGGDLRLGSCSPAVDAGDNDAVPVGTTTDLDGNPRFFDDAGAADSGNGTPPIVDMGAYEHQEDSLPTVVAVPGDFDTIQDAIDAGSCGGEIIVAPGVWEPINFNGRAVTVRSSGGPGVTTIDGAGASHVVQCVSGEGADTVLDGFTITGGQTGGQGGGMVISNSSPTVTNCTFSGNFAEVAGGMSIDNGSPTVTSCTFSGNFASVGGGMYIGNGSPTVINCTFSENSGTGGGMYNDNSSPTVTNCTFSENNATFSDGGGMYNDNSSPTATNCTFVANAANWGGGMYNGQNSSPVVTLCTFGGNISSSGGGGMFNYQGSNPTVSNCIFSGNFAEGGGGMGNDASSPMVTSCTFSGNWCIGGGMYHFSGSATVTNCIFWGNSDSFAGNTSGLSVTYSDVEGGFVGTGNIDTDPMFVDADGDDDIVGTAEDNLHLLPGSLCIDTGDPATMDEGIPDIDGDPRVLNGRVDMGVDEVRFAQETVPSGDQIVINPSGGSGDYTENSLVDFENTSGELAVITVTEVEADLHPEASFSGLGTSVVIETDLGDGLFIMTVSIPFTESDLIARGLTAEDLDLVDLRFFNEVTMTWELAVEGNCGNPPACDGVVGTRFQIEDAVTQPPASDVLGDYGVFFNTDTRAGYVFAVVDHTSDFSVGIPACPWDCQPVPNGQVDVTDFLAMLAQWGTLDTCDFDGSGVGITDFLALLANWGPCP